LLGIGVNVRPVEKEKASAFNRCNSSPRAFRAHRKPNFQESSRKFIQQVSKLTFAISHVPLKIAVFHANFADGLT
jgi:hypothetical protein